MNRKRWFGTAAVALALAVSAGVAQAKDKLTLQLKWVPQAQFAGYYVAKAKGFYDEAGLDVTIKAGGPDINPSQVIAGGGADVVVDWMPSALATREKGVPLVNFGQIFQKSGMLLTCRKDAGITAPKDFKGRTLGVWFAGNEYPFLAWMSKLGYSTSGANPDIKILKQGFNVDPLLQKQADCISTEVYNEYQQVLEAGIPESELVVFNYQNEGVATLEDGFWALDKSLADPAKVDQFARLMKATFKGWDYAAKNQKEAVQIVLDNDSTGSQTEEHQASMLRESVKLLEGATKGPGYLDPADYERTIGILLSGSSAPVISKKPEGAYTHAVYEAMEKLK